ncbi:MAG TPA: hypothetical protein VL122_13465 [Nitrospirota bacterium]|nr:hypothetical protein [Nitrospirota bacterium]
MKKECERTRQALPKYLHGHVFATSRARIERHLSQCVLCRSEYEGLRHAEETRQILKDINAPEGVIGKMKEGVSTLGKLKKVFYRPLWITGIMLIAGAVYYYEVTPRQLDLEIERIVKTAPSSTAAADNLPLSTSSVTASSSHSAIPKKTAALSVAAMNHALEPLIVTLIPENNTSAIATINEIMHGRSKLRKMKFSESRREISASLTAKELTFLFNRIEPTAKISYNQQQFNSFPAAAPIPFVLKLKAAPISVEERAQPQRAEQAAPAASAPHPAEPPPPAAETAPSPPDVH